MTGKSGRAAIVTGGCAGIGRGIAEALLAAGDDVIVCCRNAPAELPRAGEREAVFVAADVRDDEAIEAVVSAALDRFGRIDVLINNAGGAPFARVDASSPRLLRAVLELNLTAPMLFARRVNEVMQTQPAGGVVINIASVSGTRPSPGTAAYGAAKAGLLNLTQSLAVEWAPRVRVNAIVAGLVRTEKSALHYGDEAGIEAVSRTVPMQRMATPRDVADACVFLASPQASYISGAALELHGGGEIPAFLAAATANRE